MALIYALTEPETNEVRYIGYTTRDLMIRFKEHFKKLSKPNKKNNWIKHLIGQGLEPEIFVVDEVDNSEIKFWEMFYIDLFNSWGFDLKNGTKGGDGGDTFSYNPNKEQIRNKIAAITKNRKWTDEQREALSKRIRKSFIENPVKRLKYKGRINPAAKVVCHLDLLSKSITKYRSSVEASKVFDRDYREIYRMCQVKNYSLETTDIFLFEDDLQYELPLTGVIFTTPNTKSLFFKSQRHAERVLGINRSKIAKDDRFKINNSFDTVAWLRSIKNY
jgi:hypothetical protein